MASKRPLFMLVLDAARGKGLTPLDKLVLVYLGWRQGHNEAAWPSLDRIASDLEVGRRACTRSINRLCETGCVQKESGGCGRGHANKYVVAMAKRGPPVSRVEDGKRDREKSFDTRNRDRSGAQMRSGSRPKDEASNRACRSGPRAPFIAPTPKQLRQRAESLGAPPTINIQNVIIGDKNIVRDHRSVSRETATGEKNKKSLKNIVAGAVAFFAQLWTCSERLKPIGSLFHWLGF